MNNNNYNYEIERMFAKYGGEADKSITRTCGNCHFYNTERRRCLCFDDSEYKASAGCYQHRTHAEQERLAELVKQRQDEANRLRLEEQRRNGTGECAGCPFRNVNKEMYALLLDIVTDYQCMPNPAVMADKIEAVLKKARGEE